jgi:DUF3052 family protein
MAAGYSSKPLCEKLGIKPGMEVAALGAPASFRALLAPLPPGVTFARAPQRGAPFIHLFAKSRLELAEQLVMYRKTMAQDGSLWVSWPKKASKVKTDITEDVVRELAFPLGLVDVKVCAVDETWSGLKLVIRTSARK